MRTLVSKEEEEVLFANNRVCARFGRPRTKAEIKQWFLQEKPAAKANRRFQVSRVFEAPVGFVCRGKSPMHPWYDIAFTTKGRTEGYGISTLQVILYKPSPKEPARKAILVHLEEELNADVARINAMTDLSPIIQFLFDSEGQLVLANQKALNKYAGKHKISLLELFRQGIYEGGEEELQQLYEEAIHAVFVAKQDCHRLTIRMQSHRRPNERRFVLLEMWPLKDPITAADIVMVSLYNVTQQKRLEMELQEHKDLLQRQNKLLELENLKLEHEKAVIRKEKEEIFLEMQALEEHLEAVVNQRLIPPSQIDTDTPADKILTLLKGLLLGRHPKPDEILQLYTMVTQTQDLRAPVQLERQLLEDGALDTEVGLAMLQLLKGGHLTRASVAGGVERLRRSSTDAIATPEPLSGGGGGGSPDGLDRPPPGPPRNTSQEDKESKSRSSLGPRIPAAERENGDGAMAEQANGDGAAAEQRVVDGGSAVAKPRSPGGKRRNRSYLISDDTNVDEVVTCSITPEVEQILANAGHNWTFTVFSLTDASVETPLSLLTFYLMKTSGVVAEFGLDELKLSRFLRRIEEGYDSKNPYHNRIHAAAVVHQTHMMVQHCGLRRVGIVDGLTQLGCYLAAAMHDYEHRGVNNDFLIKSHDPLAILYNDTSPLENHHLAASFRLLMQPAFNFLTGMKPESQQRLRSMIIETVLATDMKKHFNITSRFQEVFRTFKNANLLANATGNNEGSYSWDNLREEDRSLARQVALKCADIGHLAGLWPVHQRWASRLEEEFFLQGDRERAAGMMVSPLMDRTTSIGISKSQVGFFNIVGVPLFQNFADVFTECQPLLDSVVENYHMWEQLNNPSNQSDGLV